MNCMIYRALAIGLACVIDLATQQPRDTETREEGMSKEQVLQRWGDALGGRQNLQNVTAMHLRGSIETGGMKGTYERWTTSRGGLRSAVDLSGVFRNVSVFDGQRGWTLDNSGAVHEITGDALKTLVSSAYEASESFLFPDRLVGGVELTSESADAGAYVLRLEAQNGVPMTVYLDAQTFLPEREETTGPMGKRVIRLSDWRTVEGVKVPGTVRQSNGDARFDAVITTEQVEINPALAADLFEKPGDATAEVQFESGAHETVAVAQVYGDHIFLPVRINGREGAWFFLDSGAGMSIVSDAWAQKAGLEVEGVVGGKGTGAGTASMGLAKSAVLEVADARVPPATIAVWNFAPIRMAMGRQWDGVLGDDVISKLVVRVDYENQRITFYHPRTFVADKKAAVLPVTFLGNLPVVHARIALPGGSVVDLECAVDSGADGFHLTSPFTNSNHLLDSVKKTISASTIGAGGLSKQYAGRIVSLQLGPYVLHEPIVTFSPDEKKGLLASSDIGAIAGGRILKRFTVTFDFPHRRILLEPNSHFAEPFRDNQSGLTLLAKGADFHEFEVDAVEAGSPADAAGLRTGDRVTAVGGHPAQELELARIDEMLSEAGRKVEITVQRGTRTLKTTLLLSERM